MYTHWLEMVFRYFRDAIKTHPSFFIVDQDTVPFFSTCCVAIIQMSFSRLSNA